MDPQQHGARADDELRRALVAFEESVVLTPDRPVPALPALIGLLHAVADLTRFALGVALSRDRTDPIHLEPRILREG
jgi:hypothetical protein